MNTDIYLELRSNPKLLRSVRGMVRTYVASYGFDTDRQDEVVLAVDEACANAIRHSYAGRDDGMVRLRLNADGDWVEICLEDDGVPCPLDKTQPPAVSGPPDVASLSPGGLGIRLMYEVFDAVKFAPGSDRGNKVTMRLKRPREQELSHGA